MRAFSLLFIFAYAIACFGAEQEPALQPQGKEPSYQGKTVSEWVVVLLKSDDQDEQCQAIRALEKIGPPAIPTLMELVKGKEPSVRLVVVPILGHFGPASIPAVTRLVKDENPRAIAPYWVRWHNGATAMGGIAGCRVVGCQATRLPCPNPNGFRSGSVSPN